MSKHREILYGHPLPQSFLDALQEFVGTMNSNLVLTRAPGSVNQVQIVAGPDNAQVGIGINGLFRYNSSTVTVAVTGPAGMYDLFVTSGANSFAMNPAPPPPEIDSTNYSFGLASVPQGSTPSGVTQFRKVGEALFDGARILVLRQMVGGEPDGTQLWQPGMVQMSAAASPGPGWLRCDGAAYSRVTYAALYAALGGPGSPWGQGDGSSTFNVPDLRDQFPVGAGASYALAGKGGAAAIALSVDQLPSHNHGGNLWDPGHAHGVADPTHAHGVYDPSHTHGSWSDQNNSAHVVIWTSGAQGNYFNTTGMAYTNIGYSATGIGIYGAATGIGIYGAATGAQVYAQGSGWTHENRPPFTGMSFFIKT